MHIGESDFSNVLVFSFFDFSKVANTVSNNKIDKVDLLRDNILNYAWNQFCKHGLRKVKVDELSAHFAISKRTLYEMFEDKEQLILACMKDKVSNDRKKIEEIKKTPDTSLEKYFYFVIDRMSEIHELNPVFYSDVLKYPKLMKFIDEMVTERNETAKFFIKQSVKEGYLRSELNYSLILETYNIQITQIVKNNLIEKYGMEQIINTLGTVLFRGCCTEKGMELMDSIVNKKTKC